MPGGPDEFSAVTFSAPYADVNSPTAAADDFWYRVAPSADGAIGLRAHLSAGSGYAPRLRTWYGTPGSLIAYMDAAVIGTGGAPIAVPTFAGVPIFIQIDSTGGTPSGAAVTFTATRAPVAATFPAGSLFIPNELAFEQPAGSGINEPLPGAVLSATDGSVMRLVPGFPGCETGDVLPSGELLVDDSYDSSVLKLFDKRLTLIANVTPPITPRAFSSTHRVSRYDDATFLVSTRNEANTDTVLWTVSKTGLVGGTTWTLPSGHITWALTVDPTTNIVYYASTSGTSGTVRRFSLDSGSGLSDLVAGVTNYSIVRDSILVLGDGTIAVGRKRTSPRDNHVRRYDAAGAQLTEYAIGGTSPISGGELNALDRVSRALDDPTSFWSWTHVFLPDGNLASLFHQWDVDAATVIAPSPFESYQQEQGTGPQNVDDPPAFGHSFSCPFIVVQASLELIVDPSIRPCVPKTKTCAPCCDSGPAVARGRTGKLRPAVEGSATSLTPPASGGRLFNTTPAPTPPERWS